MKNYILLIAITFGFYVAQAQEFEETEKYIAKSEIVTKEQAYESAQIYIMAQEDATEKVATLPISDADLFDELHITVLGKPGLNDIKEIVKVELAYDACCVYTETYYFMVRENGDFISLPKLENSYCGLPEPTEHYIFPAQQYGQEETIARTRVMYSENYMVKGIEVLQSFAWNDDDFEYEDAIIAAR